MEVVFDCSALMACLARDETPSPAWRRLLEQADLVAPALLPSELGNALLMAERRKRMTPQEIEQAAASLSALHITCEPALFSRSFDEVLLLARKYALTVYDASYLELALRRKLPLATLDDELRKAAKTARVKLA